MRVALILSDTRLFCICHLFHKAQSNTEANREPFLNKTPLAFCPYVMTGVIAGVDVVDVVAAVSTVVYLESGLT